MRIMRRSILCPCLMTVLMTTAFLISLWGSPPVLSADRDQKLKYNPTASLLRIWCIYIGQGDSLLIQFPRDSKGGEAIELLVDGGPSSSDLVPFLEALYPNGTTIENAVLTHHESDHVKGLTGLLRSANFRITNLYHNGLASWSLGSEVFPGNSFPPNAGAVTDGKTRGMAPFVGKGPKLDSGALVTSRAKLEKVLKNSKGKDNFTGEYNSLAAAAVADKGVKSFDPQKLDPSRK